MPYATTLDEVLALRSENTRLRAILKVARTHVWATSEAEHMIDGFGPRRRRPADNLLEAIDGVLSDNEQLKDQK